MLDRDDGAQSPLIRNDEHASSDHAHPHPHTHEVESRSTSPSAFIWALTFAAGISGLLFGYDTGVISSTLVSIGNDLGHPLTTFDKSLITSCTSFSALVASPLAALLADRIGRKPIVLIADVLFIIGALSQAVVTSVSGMVIGRSVVGLAVGGASLVVPLYISELSPAAFRGKLVTLSILFIAGGQVVAYIIGYALSVKRSGWRWMVGLGAAPAVFQFVLMLFLPESPRWLVKDGKTQQARGILQRVYTAGKDQAIEEVLHAIKTEIVEEEATNNDVFTSVEGNQLHIFLTRARNRLAELFNVGGNRRALTIACLLQGLQQLCGFVRWPHWQNGDIIANILQNSLMYFSATIFSLLDFYSPTMTSLSIAITNFLCTLLALMIIDRVGRRRIVLLSMPVMVLGLITCSIAYERLGHPNWNHRTTDHATSVVDDDSRRRSPWAIVILVAMVVYVCGYATGLGNVAWQQSELFPLSVRSLGSGLATGTNWGCNFVVGLTFLPMMELLTPAWTFAIYGLVCVLGWVCCWAIYPETKGLRLEDVRGLLRDSYGVDQSLRRAKIRDST